MKMLRPLAALVFVSALIFGVGLPSAMASPMASAHVVAVQSQPSCTYPTYFIFKSWSDTGHYIEGASGTNIQYDSGNNTGTEFCQLITGSWGSADGAPWSEWVLKGSDWCLTDDRSTGLLRAETCANLASQQFLLYDNLGDGEYWGGVLSWDHVSSGANYAIQDEGSGFALDDVDPWGYYTNFSWYLATCNAQNQCS